MLTIALAVVLLVAILFPDSRPGRLIRGLLIDASLRKLESFRRPHWLALLAACGVMAAALVYAKTEGVVLFSSALPDALQWFAVFDIATYMDVIGLLAILAAGVHFKAFYTALHSAVHAVRRRGLTFLHSLLGRHHARAMRRRRTPSQASGQTQDDDESREPSFAFA